MFKPLSLFIFSTFLAFPTRIIKVNALDVQPNNVRVNFDRQGGMHIESSDGSIINMPGHTTTLPDLSGLSTQTAPINRSELERYPWTSDRTTTFGLPQSSQMHCSSSGYSERSSHSSQSGTGISQSYSSTTTSICH